MLKRFGEISCICLAAISVLITAFWGYYKIFNTDITIGVNNINDQLGLDIKKVDEMTPAELDAFSERWFMEANYYDNKNKNGIELQELNFNYFRDWTLISDVYRSTGMQYVGNFRSYEFTVKNQAEADRRVVPDFYYYDSTNGISYRGGKGEYGSTATVLNRIHN